MPGEVLRVGGVADAGADGVDVAGRREGLEAEAGGKRW